jgi:hypothetical protein
MSKYFVIFCLCSGIFTRKRRNVSERCSVVAGLAYPYSVEGTSVKLFTLYSPGIGLCRIFCL